MYLDMGMEHRYLPRTEGQSADPRAFARADRSEASEAKLDARHEDLGQHLRTDCCGARLRPQQHDLPGRFGPKAIEKMPSVECGPWKVTRQGPFSDTVCPCNAATTAGQLRRLFEEGGNAASCAAVVASFADKDGGTGNIGGGFVQRRGFAKDLPSLPAAKARRDFGPASPVMETKSYIPDGLETDAASVQIRKPPFLIIKSTTCCTPIPCRS